MSKPEALVTVTLSREASRLVRAAVDRSAPKQSQRQIIEAAIYAAYGDTPSTPSTPTTTEPTSKRVEF